MVGAVEHQQGAEMHEQLKAIQMAQDTLTVIVLSCYYHVFLMVYSH
jgi:hypothetical protein